MIFKPKSGLLIAARARFKETSSFKTFCEVNLQPLGPDGNEDTTSLRTTRFINYHRSKYDGGWFRFKPLGSLTAIQAGLQSGHNHHQVH